MTIKTPLVTTTHETGWVLHPGEALRGIITDKGMTQKTFGDLVGMHMQEVSLIVNGRRNITARVALRFENATGHAARWWLNLQADYDLMMERKRAAAVQQ